MRVGLLLAVLGAEFLGLTARYEVPVLPSPILVGQHATAAWLFHVSKQFWQVPLWIAAACFLILTPHLQRIWEDLEHEARDHAWVRWLALHAIAFCAFAVITGLVFAHPTDSARLAPTWFAGWSAAGGSSVLFWLLALAPTRFWLRLLSRERVGLATGAALGIGVWMLVGMLARQEAPLGQIGLWKALSEATLRVAYALLGLVYSDLVFEPAKQLVGTPTFAVEVTYACSGIEGVVLISLFLGIYLWLFRADLRFPQVLWLLPIGVATAWLANAARIALLVVIGSSVSEDIAMQGFHAQAGWVTFTAIAVAAIASSHRLRFFSLATPPRGQAARAHPLAVALIAPLLVLLAGAMLSATFSAGFDWLYPLRVVATAWVLWHFRTAYRGLGWSWSWQAPAIGVAVFAIWMVLEPSGQRGAPLEGGWLAALWLGFRVVGSVVVVPLAEELAFRGYLMRKLVKRDFENVSLAQFTWLSFLGSSLLFGLLHGRWLAGTFAGMAYALAVYRRGQIGDAVLAHATTNALLALWVIAYGDFGVWARVAN